MITVLFICSRNALRSPTAERVFGSYRGIEVASAGLSRDAVEPVTPELVRWAQVIFVMERRHRVKLSRAFRSHLNGQQVICLNIADKYEFMDPELIRLLERRVAPHLPAQSAGESGPPNPALQRTRFARR